MLLTDSPGVVSYSTSIDPILVSVTVLEILALKLFFDRFGGEN